MIPPSFENEQELQRVLAEVIVAIEALQPSLNRMIRLLAEPPSPKGIRLVGSAASYRKPVVPALRGSTQYQFVKRAGVWIETYREDPFAARPFVAARVTETAPDPGRVQWDG